MTSPETTGPTANMLADQVYTNAIVSGPNRYVSKLHDQLRQDNCYTEVVKRGFAPIFINDPEVLSAVSDGAALALDILVNRRFLDKSTVIALSIAIRETFHNIERDSSCSDDAGKFRLGCIGMFADNGLRKNPEFAAMIDRLKSKINPDELLSDYVEKGYGFVLGCIDPAISIVMEAELREIIANSPKE